MLTGDGAAGMILELRRFDSDLRVRGRRERRVEERKAGVDGTPRSCVGLRGTVIGSAVGGSVQFF